MRRLFCLLALLCLASAGASPQMPITGTQVSSGYVDLANARLLKAAEQYSAALSRAGFIPRESFSHATVGLEGQSVHPGGHIRGACCDYQFWKGALSGIQRTDLFEDKGPASLILQHLTNDVLTLKTNDASDRAIEVLRCLGYDAEAMRKAYRIAVRDDLMDAHPVRDGGPNFPKELHFFGELISRKKIHIFVEFTPKEPSLLTNCWESAGIRLEFLATTGELLSGRLADPSALASLGVHSPDRVGPIETSDFTPPLFFSVTRKLAAPPAVISTNDAITLLRQAWSDLRQQLGSNRAQCFLLSDNLNQPAAIAREFAKLAGKIPWAGASHFWRNDLPFDRSLMDQLSHDRRGLALLAICGRAQTQLEAFRDLPDIPVPRSGDKDSEARFAKDRERLQSRIADFLGPMLPPASAPDTALFTFQACPNFASQTFCGELQSQAQGWAEVIDASGGGPYLARGTGVTYYGGTLLTNGLVVLRLSGSLPLRFDPSSILRRAPERRLVSFEVSRPITELASSFGQHPLQELFDLLGPGLITHLQQADRVEAFRVKPNEPNDWSIKGRPNIEGHEIIAHSKPLGPDFAKQVAAVLLNEKSGGIYMSMSLWMPRDALRVWRGKESTTLLICFECHQVQIKHYDASGKPIGEVWFHFGANADALAHLVKQALPAAAPAKRRPRK